MKEGYRSFTIVKMNSRMKLKSKTGGRYISRSSKNAAIKAFNRECRESKIRGQCTFTIVLRETTQGSKKNKYTYKMKRIKLKKPIKIIRETESKEKK